MSEITYSIAELANLGGVSRRTVRYYVQENLLPPPRGVGRGDHYGPEHLDRLLQVKHMQERGLTLEAIRDAFSGNAKARRTSKQTEPDRSSWTRVELADGLELHVSSNYRLPSPVRLAQLAEWCTTAFQKKEED